MRTKNRLTCLALLSLLLLACGSSDSQPATDEGNSGGDEFVKAEGDESGKADTSVLATILNFEFDGEMVVDSVNDEPTQIEDQLLYTIGHLNEDNSVGRLDRVTLSNFKTSEAEGGKSRLNYHAILPVAWGKSKTNLPTSYEFSLPLDVSNRGQSAFTDKYKSSCVEHGAHDVDSGSMWYYFRPGLSSCSLESADVIKTTAKVTVSNVNTTGKYPEYHKVWEDNALKIVTIFGKYEDGGGWGDAGVEAYNEFVGRIWDALTPYQVTVKPEDAPREPGVQVPDVSFSAQLGGGKTIEVTAILVDNVAKAAREQRFIERYEPLSTQADLIAYNGHAGLGENVRALARRGKWVAGQYVIVFMNGCDTYAYVDGSMAETRAVLNTDDPTGTKYMEIVTNAMPAYFKSDAEASMALIQGLMAHDAPVTYEQMFRKVDSSQVVLVTGEQDNVYYPGYPGGGGGSAGSGGGAEPWAGVDESGTLAKKEEKRFSTPSLAAGKYLFEMTGSGDADLYVRVGTEPTTSLYDCRPYRNGSNEKCEVQLPDNAPIHVMVRGYATTSNFHLVGKPQ